MTTTQLTVQKQKAIAGRVAILLEKHNWTQRDLARRLKKQDSYISRILNAESNMTLRTIAMLEKALGEPLIMVP